MLPIRVFDHAPSDVPRTAVVAIPVTLAFLLTSPGWLLFRLRSEKGRRDLSKFGAALLTCLTETRHGREDDTRQLSREDLRPHA